MAPHQYHTSTSKVSAAPPAGLIVGPAAGLRYLCVRPRGVGPSPQPPIAARAARGHGTGVVPIDRTGRQPVDRAGRHRRRSPPPIAGSPATAADRGTGVVPSCSPAGRPRRSPPPTIAARCQGRGTGVVPIDRTGRRPVDRAGHHRRSPIADRRVACHRRRPRYWCGTELLASPSTAPVATGGDRGDRRRRSPAVLPGPRYWCGTGQRSRPGIA